MRRKALALLCALSLVLLLAGCGRTLNQEAVGSYQLVSMTDEDGEDMSDQLELLEAFGYTARIELLEDGTGTMDLFGEVSSVKWDNHYIRTDDARSSYRLDGSDLILQEQDATLIFARVD